MLGYATSHRGRSEKKLSFTWWQNHDPSAPVEMDAMDKSGLLHDVGNKSQGKVYRFWGKYIWQAARLLNVSAEALACEENVREKGMVVSRIVSF